MSDVDTQPASDALSPNDDLFADLLGRVDGNTQCRSIITAMQQDPHIRRVFPRVWKACTNDPRSIQSLRSIASDPDGRGALTSIQQLGYLINDAFPSDEMTSMINAIDTSLRSTTTLTLEQMNETAWEQAGRERARRELESDPKVKIYFDALLAQINGDPLASFCENEQGRKCLEQLLHLQTVPWNIETARRRLKEILGNGSEKDAPAHEE